MSWNWKSKLKTVGIFVGKYVLTAGIGYLVERYGNKKAADAVKEVVGAAVAMKTAPPPDLDLALDLTLDDKLKLDRPRHAATRERIRSDLGKLIK